MDLGSFLVDERDFVNFVERVTDQERVLAIIVKAALIPKETQFLTDSQETFQVGFIVKGAGEHVPPHRHKPIVRTVTGTSEALFVKEGKCALDIYSDLGEFISTHSLGSGDVILLLSGGHGLRVLEPTVLIEVKQGPYPGIEEKDFLDDPG